MSADALKRAECVEEMVAAVNWGWSATEKGRVLSLAADVRQLVERVDDLEHVIASANPIGWAMRDDQIENADRWQKEAEAVLNKHSRPSLLEQNEKLQQAHDGLARASSMLRAEIESAHIGSREAHRAVDSSMLLRLQVEAQQRQTDRPLGSLQAPVPARPPSRGPCAGARAARTAETRHGVLAMKEPQPAPRTGWSRERRPIPVAPETLSFSVWRCWWGAVISAIEMHDGKTIAHVSVSTNTGQAPSDRLLDVVRRDFGMKRAREDNTNAIKARHLWLEQNQGALDLMAPQRTTSPTMDSERAGDGKESV